MGEGWGATHLLCIQRLHTSLLASQAEMQTASEAVSRLAAALAAARIFSNVFTESRVVRGEHGCRLEITLKPRR